MYERRYVWAVIAAGGIGRRMHAGVPKQFLKLNQKTILEQTVDVFRRMPEIDRIVVTVPADSVEVSGRLLHGGGRTRTGPAGKGVAPEPPGSSRTVDVIRGGEERQDSVREAIRFLETEGASDDDIVLIHDGVRPFVGRDLILRTAGGVIRSGAATAAVPARYTIRHITEGTLDRSRLYEIQTPQGFTFGIIRRAHQKAREDGFTGTDDAGLAERIGILPELIEGDPGNVKITTPADLARCGGTESMPSGASGRTEEKAMRIGTGYDVHRLVPDRKLILGGVEIPFETGLLGHSDADVLLHALMDALLGAADLGDIGKLFPDSDPAYEGASSVELLETVSRRLADNGYQIRNADCTIICQRPKLAPYLPEMKRNIAETLGVPERNISVKATTTEGLGFAGRGEGIAAEAVCLID